MQRSKHNPLILFVTALLVCCCIYYWDMVGMMPSGIHDWAQADRLALAIRYYEDGFNFFKPATYNLYSVNGITGVEFPVTAYIAAVIGKLFGKAGISIIFRIINTFISCMGMSFLFAAAYKRTHNFFCAAFAPLFLFSSPIYIYYTCNYLPDATAASIVCIAFYYVLDYLHEKQMKHAIIAIVLLTLASLIKTSTGLYLTGFMLYVSLSSVTGRTIHTRKDYLGFITAVCLSILALAGYFLYTRYLNERYHSTLFLSQANPFRSLDDVLIYIQSIRQYWLREYFEIPQYLVLVVLLIAMPLLFKVQYGVEYLRLLLIFFLGTLAVGILMGRQLPEHDYYFVSIFLPFFTFLVLAAIIGVYQKIGKTGIGAWNASIGFLLVIMIGISAYHQHRRIQPHYQPFDRAAPWAVQGAAMMDALHIPSSERIFVFNAYPPNLALLYCERRGYHLPPSNWEKADKAIHLMRRLQVHILICEARLVKYLTEEDDGSKGKFEVLGANAQMAVLRLKDQ